MAQERVWDGDGSSPGVRAWHDPGDLGFPGAGLLHHRLWAGFLGLLRSLYPLGCSPELTLGGGSLQPRLRLEGLPGRCMGFSVTRPPCTAASSPGKCGGREGRASPGLARGRGSGKGPWGAGRLPWNPPSFYMGDTLFLGRNRVRVPGATLPTSLFPTRSSFSHPQEPHCYLRASPHLLSPCLDPLPIVLSSPQHNLFQEAFLHLRLTYPIAVHACFQLWILPGPKPTVLAH